MGLLYNYDLCTAVQVMQVDTVGVYPAGTTLYRWNRASLRSSGTQRFLHGRPQVAPWQCVA
jgi:hypothetical protein